MHDGKPSLLSHDPSAERDLLWRAFGSAERRRTILAIVRRSDFYVQHNAEIYDVLSQLHIESPDSEIDTSMIAARCRTAAAKDALVEHPVGMDWDNGLDANISRLKDLASERRLYLACAEVMAKLVSGQATFDPKSTLDESSKTLGDAIKDREVRSTCKNLGQLVEEQAGRVTGLTPRKATTRLPIALRALEQVVPSFESGRLYVVAGRPAMGKSSLALQLALHVAQSGHRARFYSLEMSPDEITDRITAGLSGVNLTAISQDKLTERQMHLVLGAGQLVREAPFDTVDAPGMKLEDICRDARFAHARQPFQMLVVDYMQLLRSREKHKPSEREAEVAMISRELKLLARELEVPLIAVAQLNREVERRQDKRPQMSDLRESGSIEQDADTIMFVYRDGYYNPTVDARRTEIIVAKQRGGPEGKAYCTYNGHCTWFEDNV